MKLKPETVAKTVKGWGVMFPGNKTAGELAFLSGQFFEALQHRFTDEGFILAANIIRDEQEFFPTVAHVAKLSNIVADKVERNRQISQNVKLLPEDTENISEEEAAQNRERIAIITRMLSGEITAKQAEEMQSKLTTWARK